ncbi:hypothetical protein C7E18_24560, partial [Stenotrophomonas maltophilia]
TMRVSAVTAWPTWAWNRSAGSSLRGVLAQRLVHTNDASLGGDRLADMGVEPFCWLVVAWCAGAATGA